MYILKALDRFDQTPRRLFGEKQACLSLDDRLQCAAASIGDDRATRRLRLDNGDPEILLRRADEAACIPKKLGNGLLRLVAQKFDIFPGSLLQTVSLRTLADNLQRQFEA